MASSLSSRLKVSDEMRSRMQAVYDIMDSDICDRAETLLGSRLDDSLKVFLASISSHELHVALRACLLLFTVTNGAKLPRVMQLQSALANAARKDSIVDSTTGSGKTIAMVLTALLDPASATFVISPLKRLQTNQVLCFIFLFIQILMTEQVADFESYGLTAVNVNSDTPNDTRLWEVGYMRVEYRRFIDMVTNANFF